jgi:hypothetical protein
MPETRSRKGAKEAAQSSQREGFYFASLALLPLRKTAFRNCCGFRVLDFGFVISSP